MQILTSLKLGAFEDVHQGLKNVVIVCPNHLKFSTIFVYWNCNVFTCFISMNFQIWFKIQYICLPISLKYLSRVAWIRSEMQVRAEVAGGPGSRAAERRGEDRMWLPPHIVNLDCYSVQIIQGSFPHYATAHTWPLYFHPRGRGSINQSTLRFVPP